LRGSEGNSVNLHGRYLIIRADASTEMGTGHFMRCLALSQAWKDAGGRVIFITACSNESLLERLYDEGFVVHLLERPYPDPQDWETTKQILDEYHGAWLVLDGYHFDSEYQRKVKEAGHRLLVIDDMAHLPHYYADMVLNQNLHAEDLHYSCEPYTHLLLGTRYVLLRREFLAWRGWKREIPEVAQRVLVTFGGGDPENHTLKVIQALQKVDVPGLEAAVVIGASNPHANVLQSAIGQSRTAIRLVRNASNMPELMAWADVAVSSGGTTIWELMFMGVPTLAIILADNQRFAAEELDARGITKNLGAGRDVSIHKMILGMNQLVKELQVRSRMSQQAREIVDSEGAERVIMYLSGNKIRLRRAEEDDCRLFWKWANDPDVRAASFSPEWISWEQHIEWFRSKLNNSDCKLYIAVDSTDVAIGKVRFDIRGNEAVISISIDRRFRGKGYGGYLIRLASEKVLNNERIKVIHAYIKRGNEVSIRAFEKAGFKNLGTTIVHAQQAVHLALQGKDVHEQLH